MLVCSVVASPVIVAIVLFTLLLGDSLGLFGWACVAGVLCLVGLATYLTPHRAEWHCRGCGYDRRGLADTAVCPECGGDEA